MYIYVLHHKKIILLNKIILLFDIIFA